MRSFRELKRSDQREIEKLAFRGERHPNPEYALAAFVWAEQILADKRGQASRGGAGLVVDVLSQIVSASIHRVSS